MERRTGILGGRAAVLLTTSVAVLSIATGLANIGTGVAFDPFAPVIPPALRQAAAFTGTVTGFMLLIGAIGLRRQVHVAWYAVLLLFPVTALQGLVQASPLSVPLVVLSLFAIPTVFLNRHHFDQSLVLSPVQSAATIAVVGTQLYGAIGSFALQDHFVGIETITDAIYFTVVTSSTVGYGDVTARTGTGRWFAMTVVVLGTASFAAALGSLLGPAIERRLARTLGRMSDQRYDLLEDHVIVLGYGDLTEPILEELGDRPLVVVTPNDEQATALRERGYDVFTGDPTEDEILGRVGIETAEAVVAATNNDADDAFAIMTARQLNAGVRIVAAATDRDNVKKLKRSGADTVISPQVIGAHLLARSALGTAGIEAIAEKIVGADHPNDVPDEG
ncbi:NAD-binding protein [Halanaeroarchaeum sulfurireducens]|uniref:Potassium channel protein n=1 Tax=Halanaeroarchaeum sulfurireducens TaxID=1604004 RepID=A0A0F7PDE5_9EURY|nr:NAD-binding protein [Halanaeroarchaeum sulfurireducens]AKH98205.1 potassium channel protein [Halanaeroarchaeum sulfurireducens]ALG82599.1 potassium channel protein [Halanaeroarchaeum sulfurireducens]